MIVDFRVICIGIVALTTLEIVALLTGHNGTMLKIVIALIAGCMGYVIPSPFEFQKK